MSINTKLNGVIDSLFINVICLICYALLLFTPISTLIVSIVNLSKNTFYDIIEVQNNTILHPSGKHMMCVMNSSNLNIYPVNRSVSAMYHHTLCMRFMANDSFTLPNVKRLFTTSDKNVSNILTNFDDIIEYTDTKKFIMYNVTSIFTRPPYIVNVFYCMIMIFITMIMNITAFLLNVRKSNICGNNAFGRLICTLQLFIVAFNSCSIGIEYIVQHSLGTLYSTKHLRMYMYMFIPITINVILICSFIRFASFSHPTMRTNMIRRIFRLCNIIVALIVIVMVVLLNYNIPNMNSIWHFACGMGENKCQFGAMKYQIHSLFSIFFSSTLYLSIYCIVVIIVFR